MLVDELKKIVKGEVLSDEEVRVKYSRDASLFEINPEAVVFPRDVNDLKKIVEFVSHKKSSNQEISLTARAGGTDMTGGPLNSSIILDFKKYFNRIKSVGNGYAVTEPGVFYRDFEIATLKRNSLLPSFPASRETCTVGGMVANNSGGEKTLAYGKTEDYILELKAVLSDGKEYIFKPLDKKELKKIMVKKDFEGGIYRKLYKLIEKNQELLKKSKPQVSKNSAGYYLWNVWDGKHFNLTKLLVGSQGTLGLITEIKFRLITPKKYSGMAVIFLDDLDKIAMLAKKVLEFNPESFESFDDNTFKLAIRFLPSLIRAAGWQTRNFIKLFWQFLPEVWMVLSGGIPKLALLAEFTSDDEKELENRLENLQNVLVETKIKFRIIRSEMEMKKYWTIRRESFNLLRKHIKGKRTAPFIDDFIIKVEQLPEFLPKLNHILAKYNLNYTIAGHVGDANFHIIPLMDLRDIRSSEIIRNLSEEVYNLVLSYRGSITAEHNDGLIRSSYLKKMYGEKVYKLFEETKKIFDPQNIFNPGKKVNSDLNYAFKHLVKS
ncbi:MAG: FAD-binding oxidoreductase [bacterium]|nr:FAD-binding oxidoreductase [bacterium]